MSSDTTCENMAEIPDENPTKNQDVNLKSPDLGSKQGTGVAIKHRESAALNSLLAYESDSSTSSEMGTLNWQCRGSKDTSSSESSSSESSSEEEIPKTPQNRGAIRKQRPDKNAEMSLDQLPPVPDLSSLNLSVESESFVHMGNVLGIVDKLVTIAANPNSPAYDLDTLLFLDQGKRPLGFVFDVLGQVTSPIYAVRFNSVDAIKNLGIEIGTKVYSAPKSKHTQYVFLEQLLKMKGSDASWKGDNEVPQEFADYSDDENECYHRFGARKLTPYVKRAHSSDSHKKFESTMNKRNTLNTKFNKYMDSYKQARLNKTKFKRHIQSAMPTFDLTVPPPNLRAEYSYPTGVDNNNLLNPNFTPSYFTNNFVVQPNSANYFTNHAGNHYPGPSHQ